MHAKTDEPTTFPTLVSQNVQQSSTRVMFARDVIVVVCNADDGSGRAGDVVGVDQGIPPKTPFAIRFVDRDL